jgi:hypothetical protein
MFENLPLSGRVPEKCPDGNRTDWAAEEESVRGKKLCEFRCLIVFDVRTPEAVGRKRSRSGSVQASQ